MAMRVVSPSLVKNVIITYTFIIVPVPTKNALKFNV